jgi:hypothetical protein
MKTVTTTLFIHQRSDGVPIVSTADLSAFDIPFLGTHDVIVPIPANPAENAVQLRINAMHARAAQIETEASETVSSILAEANALHCELKLSKCRGK